jgi:hypothetical protein
VRVSGDGIGRHMRVLYAGCDCITIGTSILLVGNIRSSREDPPGCLGCVVHLGGGFLGRGLIELSVYIQGRDQSGIRLSKARSQSGIQRAGSVQVKVGGITSQSSAKGGIQGNHQSFSIYCFDRAISGWELSRASLPRARTRNDSTWVLQCISEHSRKLAFKIS